MSDPTTYTVSQLCGELQELVREAYGRIWVAGEVQRLRAAASGHLYFELVEKGQRDEIVGRLEAVVWRTDRQRIERALARDGQTLGDAQQIRCRGHLDLYPPSGRLQFVVRDVDPVFTLGLLERRRRETLQALGAAGLLDRNRGLPLPEVPLTIGLVTSGESAAYHDFLSGLRESGFAFRVLFVHAAVQGRPAEGEVASALRFLAGRRLDAVALIRGGGARSDLAAFDGRRLAEAVARAPFPVLTGLGHETDVSIADRVAHRSFKTPTKVAEFLVERVAAAERRLRDTGLALRRQALEPVRRRREALLRAQRTVARVEGRVREGGRRIARLAGALAKEGRRRLRQARRDHLAARWDLVRWAPRAVDRQRSRPGALARSVTAAARSRLAVAAAHLAGRSRLCDELSPERTLARGFSITRGPGGRLLRDAGAVAPGELIETRLAAGALTSRVEGGT